MTDKRKQFDCVDMKNQAQAKIYNVIKEMTSAEELAYWKERDLQFIEEREVLRTQKSSSQVFPKAV